MTLSKPVAAVATVAEPAAGVAKSTVGESSLARILVAADRARVVAVGARRGAATVAVLLRVPVAPGAVAIVVLVVDTLAKVSVVHSHCDE
eukprot:CAMPEP_0175858668 /NCGR_PEP_ID=MMETSP0107_2-20121207/29793_1 /TAXON_ID=195067 ORGANISM="Goniomonas pacifica, Strain CCMP1869" /NCGR_SAMPLE_ID=MMETSP0107_2 /ASSEMBLY_ACC=CAM_ASM_000203 /LENGTH=89 /DNA_ID=CAMNT_0017175133 /DNA_START=59 /DNA_END=325 /DNA_ORIENTATION=+